MTLVRHAGALWLVCAAVLAPQAARAVELVGTFGHWAVLRTDPPTPHCTVSTRSADGTLRLDVEPGGKGALIIFVSVTNGPSEPRGPDDRVGISWIPRAGEMRLVTYPIMGSRILPGPPVRLFVHTILRKPEEVNALLSDAPASKGVMIDLDPGYEEILPTAGFSDAWDALRVCDPGATPPLPN